MEAQTSKARAVALKAPSGGAEAKKARGAPLLLLIWRCSF